MDAAYFFWPRQTSKANVRPFNTTEHSPSNYKSFKLRPGQRHSTGVKAATGVKVDSLFTSLFVLANGSRAAPHHAARANGTGLQGSCPHLLLPAYRPPGVEQQPVRFFE
jgi:hypothetical protein